MPDVSRQERQIVGKCGENIHIRDEHSLRAQQRSGLGKSIHDRITEIDDRIGGEELLDTGNLREWYATSVCTVIEFAKGNHADGDTVMGKLAKRGYGSGDVGKRINYPIDINEVFHGRVIGRVPASRAS